jgi:hypothetical protein
MSRRRLRAQVSLPKGVHRVVSRGREYFYYQTGRGTDHVGERLKLPNDPQSPEFWQAVRQAQGIVGPVPTDTIGALIDAYEAAWPGLPRKLADSTKEQYRRSLRVVRKAWGDLQAESLGLPMCRRSLKRSVLIRRDQLTTSWTQCGPCVAGHVDRVNC